MTDYTKTLTPQTNQIDIYLDQQRESERRLAGISMAFPDEVAQFLGPDLVQNDFIEITLKPYFLDLLEHRAELLSDDGRVSPTVISSKLAEKHELSAYLAECVANARQNHVSLYGAAEIEITAIRELVTTREWSQKATTLYAIPEEPKHKIPADFDVDTFSDELANVLLNESADHEGHARAFCALFGGDYLHSDHYGWLFYNGRYWQREDATKQVERAIVPTLKARRQLAVNALREPLVKATRCSRHNINGTREQLKSLVSVDVSDFDADPDLLNVANGVLDLQTGVLRPHDITQRFTYCIPVEYDKQADATEWQEFLLDVIEGNHDLLKYIQLCLGYSLTGHIWEEVMFYVFGPARSGKGVFSETILRVMGGKPLATEVDFMTFSAPRHGDTSNFDLAPLKPCRFVAASESQKRNPLNPAKVKSLTGGNYVYCCFKHKEHFSYRPTFKIWLSSNHPCNLDTDDDAAWARLRVIRFPVSHLGQEDKRLKQRLAQPENLRGLLRWMVDGARDWYALPEGLPYPDTIKQATEAQRSEQDFVLQFLNEMTHDDPESWVSTGALWEVYNSWCESNGVPPKFQNQFSQAIKRKGYKLAQRRIDGKVKRVVEGLKMT